MHNYITTIINSLKQSRQILEKKCVKGLRTNEIRKGWVRGESSGSESIEGQKDLNKWNTKVFVFILVFFFFQKVSQKVRSKDKNLYPSPALIIVEYHQLKVGTSWTLTLIFMAQTLIIVKYHQFKGRGKLDRRKSHF